MRSPVDDPFVRGAELFDRGEFFEAHEAWEERWKVATNATERTFLQGLIQVAAAFHKLVVMKSEDAAARLLAKGLAKLDACPLHVDERGLTTFCERLHESANELAAGRLTRTAIPNITNRARTTPS